MSNTLSKLHFYAQKGLVASEFVSTIEAFYPIYKAAAEHSDYAWKKPFMDWIDFVTNQLQKPYAFEIFHKALRSPIDYYQFGLDFIRPLVDFDKSLLLGEENIREIITSISHKENVFLLANHQTEPDPQLISLLLEKDFAEFASKIIFIAGDRVIKDALAVPFSLGRNLLCIYSKKHIDFPEEEKTFKILHNQKTLKKLGDLLKEGGYCFYIALSGGRDRQNKEGIVEVAPFDPQSLEMLALLAQQTSYPTHFYPLALSTYALMPPPLEVEKELGEERLAFFKPVGVAFGSKIPLSFFSQEKTTEKKTERKKRAEEVWKLVVSLYARIQC